MTGFEKLVALLFAKKGLVLGFGIGLMKVLKDIRDGKFKWKTAITDLMGSIIIGYSAYQIVSLTDMTEVMKISWTIFSSANAFVVMAILTDQKVFREIINKYFH